MEEKVYTYLNDFDEDILKIEILYRDQADLARSINRACCILSEKASKHLRFDVDFIKDDDETHGAYQPNLNR
jgi:hypothetical protein